MFKNKITRKVYRFFKGEFLWEVWNPDSAPLNAMLASKKKIKSILYTSTHEDSASGSPITQVVFVNQENLNNFSGANCVD